jgi:hypothetical protein
MTRRSQIWIALALAWSLLPGQSATAADRSWNKIRYQSGTVDVKVNPFDWNTTLRISGAQIELNFSGRRKIIIEGRSVTVLSRGDIAYRRIIELISGNGSSRPVPLFGILQSDRDHLIGVEFNGSNGSHSGVLLLIQRDSYNEVLGALSEVTSQPVKESF